MPRNVGVVVVAGGAGTRVGGDTPKQFLPLAGVPVLLHALRPFTSHPDVHHVVVVLPPEYAADPPPWLSPLLGGALTVAVGGARRRDSVRAGLHALPVECEVVLVHDGARPFPPREVVDAVIATARAGRGAVPALPVADTIKRADEYGRVLSSVPRDGLWLVQTPQGFPREMLARAHAAPSDTPATDDAMLVEQMGDHVDLVTGAARNLKITTPTDLVLAEWYATHR